MEKEYIEKQAVEDMFKNAHIIFDEEYCGYCIEGIDINSIPVADVVPVRHGKWIRKVENDGYAMSLCSACSFPVHIYWGESKFCPSCGAKMDLED